MCRCRSLQVSNPWHLVPEWAGRHSATECATAKTELVVSPSSRGGSNHCYSHWRGGPATRSCVRWAAERGLAQSRDARPARGCPKRLAAGRRALMEPVTWTWTFAPRPVRRSGEKCWHWRCGVGDRSLLRMRAAGSDEWTRCAARSSAASSASAMVRRWSTWRGLTQSVQVRFARETRPAGCVLVAIAASRD